VAATLTATLEPLEIIRVLELGLKPTAERRGLEEKSVVALRPIRHLLLAKKLADSAGPEPMLPPAPQMAPMPLDEPLEEAEEVAVVLTLDGGILGLEVPEVLSVPPRMLVVQVMVTMAHLPQRATPMAAVAALEAMVAPLRLAMAESMVAVGLAVAVATTLVRSLEESERLALSW